MTHIVQIWVEHTTHAHTHTRTHTHTYAHLCFLLGLDKFLPVLIVLSNVHHHSRDGKEFWTMWEQTCYCKTLTLAYMHTASPLHTRTHTGVHECMHTYTSKHIHHISDLLKINLSFHTYVRMYVTPGSPLSLYAMPTTQVQYAMLTTQVQ